MISSVSNSTQYSRVASVWVTNGSEAVNDQLYFPQRESSSASRACYSCVSQGTGSNPHLWCVHMLTWSQRFLSAGVILSWLLYVPGCQRQRLHVLQTVEPQHVHVAAAALVSGNEAAFATFKHIFDDFLSAHFIVHAEKHCNPLTGHILGMSEQLKENTET